MNARWKDFVKTANGGDAAIIEALFRPRRPAPPVRAPMQIGPAPAPASAPMSEPKKARPAGREGIDWGRAEPSRDVKHYYDVIVPYIRAHSRTAGRPGLDYNPELFVPGFYNNIPIMERDSSQDDYLARKPWVVGYSYPGYPGGIVLRKGKDDDFTQVHENKHQQNRDGLGGMSGRSAEDNLALRLAYKFTPADIRYGGPEQPYREAGASNAEYQAYIMKGLANGSGTGTGRLPSGREFKEGFANASDAQKFAWWSWVPNGYVGDSRRRRGEAFRQELMREARRLGIPDTIRIRGRTREAQAAELRQQPWFRQSSGPMTLRFNNIFGVPESLKDRDPEGYMWDVHPRSDWIEDRILEKLWEEDKQSWADAILNVRNDGGAYRRSMMPRPSTSMA